MYRPNEQDSGISLSRVLIAVGLSIAFFAVYAYFFPQTPTQVAEKTQATSSEVSGADVAGIESQDSISSPHTPSKSSATQASSTSALPTSQPLKQTIIAHIQSDAFEIEIDALGRIKQVYLKDEQFTRGEQKSLFGMVGEVLGFKTSHREAVEKLPLFDNGGLHTMEVRFSDSNLNQRAFNTPYTTNLKHIELESAPIEIVLTQDLDDVVLTKYLTIHPNLRYDVRIELDKPNVEYFVSNGMRPTADPDTYAFRGVVTRNAFDGVLTKIEDGDASSDYLAKTAVDMRNSSFIASVDRYYTSLFFTKESQGFYVVMSGDNAHNPMPYVRFEGNANFAGYIGPKIYKELQRIDESLTDVVEYGRITFFAKPLFVLLEYLYNLCGNWGWAIVFLTLIVRIVLYPLTYRGMMSMQKLKDLAPKMKELQTRYKDDPQKLQMHMMDLYKNTEQIRSVAVCLCSYKFLCFLQSIVCYITRWNSKARSGFYGLAIYPLSTRILYCLCLWEGVCISLKSLHPQISQTQCRKRFSKCCLSFLQYFLLSFLFQRGSCCIGRLIMYFRFSSKCS